MKITDVKQQKSKKERYSIYVDGRYAFSLTDWQLNNAMLKPGDEIDDQQIKAFIVDSEFGKVYELTMRWIAIRARSEWEIDDYLRKKTESDEVKLMIKERLDKLGQINDIEFARSWVNSRRQLKSKSELRLKQELKQKRVSDEAIAQVLASDEADEIEIIKHLVEKKRRQTRYQDDEKLLAYLSRQGFTYGDIKQALQSPQD